MSPCINGPGKSTVFTILPSFASTSPLKNTASVETVSDMDSWCGTFDALLQQKRMQMNNNLAEQQVNNNNNKAKTKQESQEQLSSPLSQVLMTYDFGNFENCELKVKLSELSSTSYPQLYHEHRHLHKKIRLNMDLSCSPMYLWYKCSCSSTSWKRIFLIN